MTVNRKLPTFLQVSAKCLTVFEWEFCDLDKLSECKHQFFDHAQAGSDLFTPYKTRRRCTRVLITHLAKAHFRKLDPLVVHRHGSKTLNS